MTLDDYLKRPSAPTVAEFRLLLAAHGATVKNDAQIRQWRTHFRGRKPSPLNCAIIERATDGAVTRADLRPDDYWLIWPDLLPQQRRPRGRA